MVASEKQVRYAVTLIAQFLNQRPDELPEGGRRFVGYTNGERFIRIDRLQDLDLYDARALITDLKDGWWS